ncbi:MAG TPA: UDP-N-acetylglucosamine pyrophosphorylase [candidate division Zixibacteria bacterium]|nr:UDP-N-acetylglucosamine pyrophosphorylase [candidate division Zixibacteria bacterium]
MLGIVILAAGEGKRMKSDRAKVLVEVAGKPMIDSVLEAAKALEPDKIALVVGNRMEQVIAHLREAGVVFCAQLEQKGTADAVKCAQAPFMGWEGEILVLCGDTPFITPETLQKLLDFHRESGASATVLTAIHDDPKEYGRIVRDDDGQFIGIVEFADADDNIRGIREVNGGIYVFDAQSLWPALDKIGTGNVQGEFYLTDIFTILLDEGKKVSAIPAENPLETAGINRFEQIEEYEKML